MTRFRQEHGLISWTRREGSDNIRESLISKLPQQNIDANSTRGVLPPSLVAQADARSRNKGQHSARAGGRALSVQERQRREDKENERLAKLRATEVDSSEKVQVQISNKRKRTTQASPGIDEAEVMNKRYKVGSPSPIVQPVLEAPGLPPPLPRQSTPALQKSRKRSRDDSWSKCYDEGSTTKRQCRRPASPTQRVEQRDRAKGVEDPTQNVVEEELTLNDTRSSGEERAVFCDLRGSPVAPEVLVAPEVFAAPEAPPTPEARMVVETPTIQVHDRESEGTSPLELQYKLIAEEFQFPNFDEGMTLEEILQRDLDRWYCE